MEELARGGEKKILVCPISFTADCLETIEELGLRYRKLVEAQGGELFLCPALNTYRPFISAMKHLVLAGPQTAEFSPVVISREVDGAPRVPPVGFLVGEWTPRTKVRQQRRRKTACFGLS